jgi:hypothetical protein
VFVEAGTVTSAVPSVSCALRSDDTEARNDFVGCFGRSDRSAQRWCAPREDLPGYLGFVFAAHNIHDPSCGRPPRLRKTADPVLYYGCLENCYGEQFVFTFDRAIRAGTIGRGD